MAGPSEPAGPWDTTFNRAMNTTKGRDKSKPPTSAGRVSGFGTAMKFIEYYSTDTDNKRTRRKPSNTSAQVAELTEEVAELKKQKVDQATVNQLVAEKVDERLRAMFPPNLVEGISAWYAGGQQGPIHVPSFGGSNSTNVSPVMVTPPLPPTVSPDMLPPPVPPRPTKKDNAPERPSTAAPLVSTLAELDAVDKVTIYAVFNVSHISQACIVPNKFNYSHRTRLAYSFIRWGSAAS